LHSDDEGILCGYSGLIDEKLFFALKEIGNNIVGKLFYKQMLWGKNRKYGAPPY